MSMISATIRKAKAPRRCAGCNKWIDIGQQHLRLFGSYERDPPYEIRYCLKCAPKLTDRTGKIKKALDGIKKEAVDVSDSGNSEK